MNYKHLTFPLMLPREESIMKGNLEYTSNPKSRFAEVGQMQVHCYNYAKKRDMLKLLSCVGNVMCVGFMESIFQPEFLKSPNRDIFVSDIDKFINGNFEVNINPDQYQGQIGNVLKRLRKIDDENLKINVVILNNREVNSWKILHRCRYSFDENMDTNKVVFSKKNVLPRGTTFGSSNSVAEMTKNFLAEGEHTHFDHSDSEIKSTERMLVEIGIYYSLNIR